MKLVKFCDLLIPTLVVISGVSLTFGQRPLNEPQRAYEYQTKLKGGYRLSYFEDSELQHLYLVKGSKRIRELESISAGLPQKNLGYIGADFQSFFVLVHSFGSGNPHYIELIKKSTGKSVLGDGAAWIDVDEKKEVLLFSSKDVPTVDDKMVLLDVRTGRKESFPYPKGIFGEADVLNRIRIKKVAASQLIIRYEVGGKEKVIAYRRT